MAPNQRKGKREEWDFQKRAEERKQQPITMPDGTVYHRRVKDHDLSRDARRLSAEVQEASLEAEETREKAVDAPAGNARKKLREEAEAHEDRGLDLMYDLAGMLIEDENGKSPAGADLKATGLEVEECGRLTNRLGGGDEPLEGPTPNEDS